MLTDIEIASWKSEPGMLEVTVSIPALPYMTSTFFHRAGSRVGDPNFLRGWFCNGTQGALPSHDGFQELMDSLVLAHPVLRNLAVHYQIGQITGAMILTEVGPRWIDTIRQIRLVNDTGLRDAKELVDTVRFQDHSVVIASDVTTDQVAEITRMFREVGATVVFNPKGLALP